MVQVSSLSLRCHIANLGSGDILDKFMINFEIKPNHEEKADDKKNREFLMIFMMFSQEFNEINEGKDVESWIKDHPYSI